MQNTLETNERPVVGIVMGSNSDWDVMQHAARMLKDFGVPSSKPAS